MNRRIKINVTNTYNLDKKVIEFFKSYDFELIENKEGIIKFRRRSSLLEAWKTNPLKWGSEIYILLFDKTLEVDFIVDTDTQLNTKEEKKVWQTFINNFRSFLVSGDSGNLKLTSTIFESRKSRINYFWWAILGGLTGGILSFIYTKLTDNNSLLVLIIIPIMTTAFLNWKIKYEKTKNA